MVPRRRCEPEVPDDVHRRVSVGRSQAGKTTWQQRYVQDDGCHAAPDLNMACGTTCSSTTSFNNLFDMTGRESLKQLIESDIAPRQQQRRPRAASREDVTGDGKHLVRGAYGRFYHYLPQAL